MIPVLIHVRPIDLATGLRVDIRVGSAADATALGLNNLSWEPIVARRPRIAQDTMSLDLDGRFKLAAADLGLALSSMKQHPAPHRLYFVDAPIIIYRATDLDWSRITIEFAGLVSSAAPDLDTKRVTLNCIVDRTRIDKPLLTGSFGGGGDADGVAAVRGTLKPAGFGYVESVEWVLFDPTYNIGMLDGYGNLLSVQAALEGLNNLGASVGDYATYAALKAAIIAGTIPRGRWGTCIAQGMVGLGAPPAGRITFHATFGFNRTGAIIKRMLGTHAALAATEYIVGAFDALDVSVNREVRAHFRDQAQISDVIEAMCRPLNATPLVTVQNLIAVTRSTASAPIAVINRSGSYPKITGWRMGDPIAPTYKIIYRAARPASVLTYDEVLFTDRIEDKGLYSGAATYRAGHIVWLANKSSYLYINATPSAGNAPPTVTPFNNTFWQRQQPPADAISITYASGQTIESLKPAQVNADQTSVNTASGIAGQAPAATDTTIQSGATRDVVLDTRVTNSPPSYYRAAGKSLRLNMEFKEQVAIGVGTAGYATLETIDHFGHSSGGPVWQRATNDTGQRSIRYSTSETVWSSWQPEYSGNRKPYFGADMLEAAGGALATLSAFKTSLGIAGSVAGQGALATKNAAAWGTDVGGRPLWATDTINNPGGTPTLQSGYVSIGGGDNVKNLFNYFPSTTLSDRTSNANSAGFTGQGILATRADVLLGTHVKDGFGGIITADRVTANLADLSNWKPGATLNFNGAATALRQQPFGGLGNEVLVLDPAGPSGTSETVWRMTTIAGGAAYQGLMQYLVPLAAGFDPKRTYRFTVWAKHNWANPSAGYFYAGPPGGAAGQEAVNTLAGAADGNPYWGTFLDGTTADKWYLFVGIIHGSDYTGGQSAVSGLYDPVTGARVRNATAEFKWRAAAPTGGFNLVFYFGETGKSISLAKPKMEELNAGAPSVQQMMATVGGTFGVNMFETTGGALALLNAFKTALGIAGSIAGQGPFATGTSYGNLTLLPSSLANLHSNGYMRAGYIQNNGQTGDLQTFFPSTIGADKTSGGTAAGIINQGPSATDTRGLDRLYRPSQNSLYNGSFALGLESWGVAAGTWTVVKGIIGFAAMANTISGGLALIQSSAPVDVLSGTVVTLSGVMTGTLGAGINAFVDILWINGGNQAGIGYSSNPPYGTNDAIWYGAGTFTDAKRSVTTTAPAATDGSGFVRALVRVVTFGAGPYFADVKIEKGSVATAFSDEMTANALANRTMRFNQVGRVLDPTVYNTQLLLGPNNTTSLQPTYTVGGSNVTVNLPAHVRKIADVTGPRTLSYGAVSGVVAFSTYWTAYFVDPNFTGLASPTVVFTANPDDLLYPDRYQVASGVSPNAAGTGGGAGDGGGEGPRWENCVAAESFMPLHRRRALAIRAGDEVSVVCEETWACSVTRLVDACHLAEEQCVRLTSLSGISVVVSASTPCTQRGGATVPAPDALGIELAVEDERGFRWERIVEVEHVGMRAVVNLTCGNGTYGAGERPGRFMFTHNVINKA